MPPELKASCGVPVTSTALLNETVTGTTWPTVYEPFAKVDDTAVTVAGPTGGTLTLPVMSEAVKY